jgi:polyhydroxybutyrate depolymerase
VSPSRRVTVVVALCLIAVLLTGCGRNRRNARRDDAPAVSGTCAPTKGHNPGVSRQTITSEGIPRRYSQYIPASYDGAKAMPVVLLFHGYSGNPAEIMDYTAMHTFADEKGFVLIAPIGQGHPPHFAVGFGLTVPGDRDDGVFTRAVLRRVQRTLCVDPKRVYAVGLSNGGAMVSLLACAAPDRIAAFVAIAAVLYHQDVCANAPPVPFVAIQGTADPLVPFTGGTVQCCGDPTFPPVGATMGRWAAHDGCELKPDRNRVADDVELLGWSDCDGDASVQLYVIEGGGHTWPGAPESRGPGAGPTTHSISANEIAWDFFMNHELP